MTNFKRNFLISTVSILGAAGAALWYLKRYRDQRENKLVKIWKELIGLQLCVGRPQVKVDLVSSLEDWKKIEYEFLKRVDASRIIGLDCEWVSNGNNVGRVDLIQIGLPDGWCILFRTCKVPIPESLKEVLRRYDILKLGVAVIDDGKKLLSDYGVTVNGTVDLRHIVQLYCPGKCRRLGLQSLASYFLGLHLDKDWRIRGSDWNNEVLDEEHVKYAANDALASINVGLAVAAIVPESVCRHLTKVSVDPIESLADKTRNLCLPFAGVRYKTRFDKPREYSDEQTSFRPNKNNKDNVKTKPRNKHCIRKSPLYHNATLEAPDGQMLCVCDIKKAMWYVEKDLGTLVTEEPLIVRLKFEPSGRPEGPAGKYYLTVKENICVVCGKTESYLRKYIVPHEYRKFFPEIMRDHQSHDVLLMCTECHQVSNSHDMILRRQLAAKCNAPIGSEDDVKYHEVSDLKVIRSAARALLKDGSKGLIPATRRAELTKVLLDYFKIPEITQDILVQAANFEPTVLNESYVPHGKRVVDFYIEHEGIIPLERLWRQHFLGTMQPKFLPPLWSVDHQKHRLDIRAAENRIDPSDYSIANEGQGKTNSNGEQS